MGLPTNHNTFPERSSAPHPAASSASAGAGPLDAAAVRARFPLMEAGQKMKRPLTYLDNAATTHKPECVLSAEEFFYRCANANVDRGVHPLAKSSTKLYEKARRMAAAFIGAADDEIVFTSGTTAGLNLVAFSYGLANLKPGDEVALTMAEHHSNLLPWQHVAQATGAKLVHLLLDEEGVVSDEEIAAKIGPRTKIAAVAHVSNVLGSVQPVRRIADAVHAAGGVLVADCAQSVAHLPVDARALGADFLAFSGHKMFAPMGTGVLFGRRELLEGMDPFLRGGGMIESVFERSASFAPAPARFEAGTPNIAGATGLAEAMRFMLELGYDAVRDHERRLLERLLAGLSAVPGVRVHGATRVEGAPDADEPLRCGVVSFNVAGVDANDVAAALARDNVAIRAGAHCAEPLVRYLGERATCRASLALYNDEADVDRFLESVEHAKRTVSRMIMASMH
ncbi:aminotransferase class V-fold PLP-dependent enzyme [Arabiibacter massiliensis]|uniref:aminotransferase class V-fold PLP-dependent enzyme n=1 Tax=Arabiibacter massiliensis TaxID=1870985 RepID=UPI0009BB5C61|nr:cysteine desulfurase [Arabiibacter massiliensis]